jgi:uncharacterized protein
MLGRPGPPIRLCAGALLAWLLVLFALPAQAQQGPQFPKLTGRVVDAANVIPPDVEARLDQKLAALEQQSRRQLVVATIPDLQGYDIADYGYQLGRAWGIGGKERNDGALLIVAPDERKLRIEVGYGLEGVLTDVTTKRLIDEVITPKFKSGDFAGGISDGISRMIGLVNGEKLPEPEPPHWDSQQHFDLEAFNPFWLFFAFVVSSILRSTLGRLVGSIGTGLFVAVLAWFLLGSALLALGAGILAFIFTMLIDFSSSGRGSSSSSSGWSGGSSSSSDWSSSSSSSSDSGGFSGGGGSFGGGGASGSW